MAGGARCAAARARLCLRAGRGAGAAAPATCRAPARRRCDQDRACRRRRGLHRCGHRPPANSAACSPRRAATARTAMSCAKRSLLPDRLVSPTRFTNSVHNAAAGYWHIAVGSQAASTSRERLRCELRCRTARSLHATAGDRRAPLLLVASDTPYPEPLHATRPLPGSFAVAHGAGAGATRRRTGPALAGTALRRRGRCCDALQHARAGRPAPQHPGRAFIAAAGGAWPMAAARPWCSTSSRSCACVCSSPCSDTMRDDAPFTGMDHEAIARLIPHSGSMCLLERMVELGRDANPLPRHEPPATRQPAAHRQRPAVHSGDRVRGAGDGAARRAAGPGQGGTCRAPASSPAPAACACTGFGWTTCRRRSMYTRRASRATVASCSTLRSRPSGRGGRGGSRGRHPQLSEDSMTLSAQRRWPATTPARRGESTARYAPRLP